VSVDVGSERRRVRLSDDVDSGTHAHHSTDHRLVQLRPALAAASHQSQARRQEMKLLIGGGCFCKKVDLSSTQGALCRVSVFLILHFTYLGVRMHPAPPPLPTGLQSASSSSLSSTDFSVYVKHYKRIHRSTRQRLHYRLRCRRSMWSILCKYNVVHKPEVHGGPKKLYIFFNTPYIWNRSRKIEVDFTKKCS